MSRVDVICIACGERYESDLFTDDPGETFVCPMCGTLIIPAGDVPAAAQAADEADAA